MMAVMKTLQGVNLCHCLAARRHARLLTRLYDRHLAAVNLSVSQFSILALIHQQPGILIAELADLMAMERTTLLRALKPLQSEGLLISEAEGARAAIRLTLSAQGRVKHDQAEVFWEAAQQEHEQTTGVEAATSLRCALFEQDFGG
ncbi:MarR family winged helix-turn-helix transcriptional regulator [Pseudomonas sp. NPDC090202]|uniref:MarR family winged helix-turn-helix transcriptional regulator n=1 Tax=unclassified Pseudomonas TaxID=196821 RepID=UPI00382711C3